MMGCDMAQGFGVARPMPMADLLTFLEHDPAGDDRLRNAS
jgi:EAL domain-containing protein (putative c-di-GMP-specific phosphodiesterase class I)